MMEGNFKALAELLDAALAFNLAHREAVPQAAKDHFDAPSFAAEFCTVRLDVGRRSGKSSLIAERAGPDDIVIVSSGAGKAWFPKTKATVLAVDEALRHVPAAGLTTIWVDEPSFSMCRTNKERDAIYERLCGATGSRTFVLVGM